MRHRTDIDRGVRRRPEQDPYVCYHRDCRRVLWLDVSLNDVKRVHYARCLECGRETEYNKIDVPDDTIMLDNNGDPIQKGEEDKIPTTADADAI